MPVQVAPPRSDRSQLSPPSIVPLPQDRGGGYGGQPPVAKVQPGVHASVPGLNPRLEQLAPARSVGSQSSPGSIVPSPQYAVPFTAGTHSSDALKLVSARFPNWSVTDWSGTGVIGVGHFTL